MHNIKLNCIIGTNVAQASRLCNTNSRDDCSTLSSFIPLDYGMPIDIFRCNLPHWKQSGKTYFVTFRLADSLPREKLKEWKEQRVNWLKQHNQPYTESDWKQYNELFSERINNYLNAGYGSCLLKDERVAHIVSDALKFYDGKRYALGEWVIMPNHVHLIIETSNEHDISDIMRSIKSYTAHEINKLLCISGQVWQDESFDHIIRSARQKNRLEQYIFDNPKNAGLKNGYICSTGVPPV